MKNEILAMAITGIDDDLIADAHTVPAPKLISFKRAAALAACLAVIVSTAIWFSSNNRTSITVFNQKLSAEPITISQKTDNPDLRVYSQADDIQLSAEIEIKVNGETTISVSSGSMQITDLDGNILMYDGTRYKTESNVQIIWSVEAAADVTQFKMTVEDKQETDEVLLAYDQNNQKWVVSKIIK